MNKIVESHTIAEASEQSISIYTEIETLPTGEFKVTIRQLVLNKLNLKTRSKQIYTKLIKA